MTVTRGKPAPQELAVGGEFYGYTERYSISNKVARNLLDINWDQDTKL